MSLKHKNVRVPYVRSYLGQDTLFQRKYGITLAARNALFALQGHKCAGCGANDYAAPIKWHTDHSHKTGIVRGILCADCNRALGLLKEDPVRIRKLARYIKYHNAL